MPELQPNGLRVVLYEGADSRPFDPARRVGLLSTLLEAGYQVTRTVAGGDAFSLERQPLSPPRVTYASRSFA